MTSIGCRPLYYPEMQATFKIAQIVYSISTDNRDRCTYMEVLSCSE
jgi:hypothetical protein